LLHLQKLSETQKISVLKLIDETTAIDNTPQIAEHILLYLRHGGDKVGSHLMVEKNNQIIGYAFLDKSDLISGPSVQLVVDPRHRDNSVDKQLLSKAVEICGANLALWVRGNLPLSNSLLKSFTFKKIRSVHQMSKSLNNSQLINKMDLKVLYRNFLPEQDSKAWLSLNNRVFKDHPEQGNWELSDLNFRLKEDWFDSTGFFIAEYRNLMIGSIWIKIHSSNKLSHAQNFAQIGEIYQIAVDPDFQGQGLGKRLILSAENYLFSKGFKYLILYVDESNSVALRLYSSLGFKTSNIDKLMKLVYPGEI
jgi:mycothiol synthase